MQKNKRKGSEFRLLPHRLTRWCTRSSCCGWAVRRARWTLTGSRWSLSPPKEACWPLQKEEREHPGTRDKSSSRCGVQLTKANEHARWLGLLWSWTCFRGAAGTRGWVRILTVLFCPRRSHLVPHQLHRGRRPGPRRPEPGLSGGGRGEGSDHPHLLPRLPHTQYWWHHDGGEPDGRPQLEQAQEHLQPGRGQALCPWTWHWHPGGLNTGSSFLSKHQVFGCLCSSIG